MSTGSVVLLPPPSYLSSDGSFLQLSLSNLSDREWPEGRPERRTRRQRHREVKFQMILSSGQGRRGGGPDSMVKTPDDCDPLEAQIAQFGYVRVVGIALRDFSCRMCNGAT